jgi:hypothetical protein
MDHPLLSEKVIIWPDLSFLVGGLVLVSGRSLVERLECHIVNGEVVSPGFNSSILQPSGICGAADEAVLKKLLKNSNWVRDPDLVRR